MHKISKSFFLVIILISIKLYSQEFFVTTVNVTPGIPPSNSVYRLDVSSPSESPEAFCLPTIIANEGYTDIALDKFGNFYYVTATGLLYRKNKTESGCEYLGDFSNGDINSLVADSENSLYAIGTFGKLYRYDSLSGTFTELGDIPTGQISGGDLFFYENRLFLTTSGGVIEINMLNPSQSCPFMSLGIQYPSLYAGFSIDYGNYSKAYVISNVGQNSIMYEVDMVNKQISSPIRTYNHRIYGAATAYSLTSSNAACSPTLSVQENKNQDLFFNIINPAKNIIIFKTNIERKQITTIRLFDSTGRLIKDFSNQNNLENLDISDVSSGNYLLTVTTKKGETYTKKLIIKG